MNPFRDLMPSLTDVPGVGHAQLGRDFGRLQGAIARAATVVVVAKRQDETAAAGPATTQPTSSSADSKDRK